MKKGTILTLPTKSLHWNIVNDKATKDSYSTAISGWKVRIFGTITAKGKKYFLVDTPNYTGSNYYMVLQTDLSTKTTNMATKQTAVSAVKAKAFPRAELKTGMTISATGIKGPAIIVVERDYAFICSNDVRLSGSAPANRHGFKYGWSLSRGTKIDLTYAKRFSSIKLGTAPVAKKAVKKVVEKKEFANTFGVVGSKTLLKAFAEEAVAAGWKSDKSTVGSGYKDLYFTAVGDSISPAQSFRADGVSEVKPVPFKLPAQWDAAIKAMKEKKAVVKFPIYCAANSTCKGQFTKGRIYKITGEKLGTYYTATDDAGSTTNGWDNDNFTLSTEKAFLAQAPLFVPIETLGGWSVSVKRASVSGYASSGIPVICIGCVDSQQVYTKASLESLLVALKTCGEASHPRGVRMDVKTVETLIEMLNRA